MSGCGGSRAGCGDRTSGFADLGRDVVDWERDVVAEASDVTAGDRDIVAEGWDAVTLGRDAVSEAWGGRPKLWMGGQRAIAFINVGWTGAAKRHLSHPTACAVPTRRWSTVVCGGQFPPYNSLPSEV